MKQNTREKVCQQGRSGVERGQCECHHDAAWLKQEIAARRWVQGYRVGENGEYVLVCVICDGLWDHRATDRLIDLICGSSSQNNPLPVQVGARP